ncbi:MAG: hypothetical protein HC828_12625, partial [Blastochloris sp.]|nr:hypothetical protein [Blastochloris sp.]
IEEENQLAFDQIRDLFVRVAVRRVGLVHRAIGKVEHHHHQVIGVRDVAFALSPIVVRGAFSACTRLMTTPSQYQRIAYSLASVPRISKPRCVERGLILAVS